MTVAAKIVVAVCVAVVLIAVTALVVVTVTDRDAAPAPAAMPTSTTPSTTMPTSTTPSTTMPSTSPTMSMTPGEVRRFTNVNPTTTEPVYCDTDWLLDRLEAQLAEIDAQRRDETSGLRHEMLKAKVVADYAGIATDIWRDSGYSCVTSDRHRRTFEALISSR